MRKRILKGILIAMSILTLVFVIMQAFVSNSTEKTESYKYTVLKTYDEFEIRRYDEGTFSYVNMPYSTYKESSGMGFRTLAGYIFGDNETGEKIAMTTPVSMEIGDSTTIMFLVPSEYQMNDLPRPLNSDVKFKKVSSRTVAAIHFGGWASDERIEEHKELLIKLLRENEIIPKGNFIFLGYNPPFELMNRRNEVIVEIDVNSLTN